MADNLITVREASMILGLPARTLYSAIAEGRLPAQRVLNRLAVREEDALRYEPTRYAGRPGAKGRGGRPKGTPMSPAAKAQISLAQKQRWAKRKAGPIENE